MPEPVGAQREPFRLSKTGAQNDTGNGFRLRLKFLRELAEGTFSMGHPRGFQVQMAPNEMGVSESPIEMEIPLTT